MRVAIIGVGRMGRRHIQVTRSLGLELVGICDADPSALAVAAKECALRPNLMFTNARDLFDKKQPECVIIGTTAPTHCSYTCTAADAGVGYILCEKPMAVSLAECDKMINVCREHGVKLAINHQMRFMEQYVEPKRLIKSPEFGGLCSVTVVAGNFGIAMNGTHYFEMFRYITDSNISEVTAWFSKEKLANPRGAQYEDRAGSVRLTTASGHRFYMEVGCDQGHGLSVLYAGVHGQILVEELAGSMTLSFREEGYRQLPTSAYGQPAVTQTIRIAPVDVLGPTEAVLEALITNANFTTGEDARLSIAALVASYVSDENGHTAVRTDRECLPLDRVFPWA